MDLIGFKFGRKHGFAPTGANAAKTTSISHPSEWLPIQNLTRYQFYVLLTSQIKGVDKIKQYPIIIRGFSSYNILSVPINQINFGGLMLASAKDENSPIDIFIIIDEIGGETNILRGGADQFQIEMFEKIADPRNGIEFAKHRLGEKSGLNKLEYEIQISIFPPVQ